MVRFHTNFAEEGYSSRVPRELVAEIEGDADSSLSQAIDIYWNVANGFTPAFALIGNSLADDLEVHLAFDATPGDSQHDFFQNFLPVDTGAPHHGREIAPEAAMAVFSALEQSPHKARLMRAAAYYREALRYLKPGQESLLILYLWMAVEALTKVALRTALTRAACTENELLIKWGLASPTADLESLKKSKRGLDGEVRRRLIFHGDAKCQADTVSASDGFEHGFKTLDEVMALALRAKAAGAAEHVRLAIFELMDLGAETTTTLTSGKYQKPGGIWPIAK